MFAVCFILFGATMFLMGRAFLVREKQASLYATAAEVGRYAEAMHTEEELSSWELRMNLAAIAQSTGDHIFLCDPAGTVVSSSDRDLTATYIGRQVPAAVVEKLAKDGSYEGLTTLDGFYEAMYYVVAQPLADEDGTVIGYVFVNYAGSGIFGAWGGFLLVSVVIAAGMLAVAVSFEYASVRRLARPLNEMTEAAGFKRPSHSAEEDASEPWCATFNTSMPPSRTVYLP